jgi:acetyl esterase/lipase
MIHGGGFVHGKRSDGRDWDRWFAERGYTVFDVDYRLNPPVNWNLAAADVACALSWIRQHEQELNVVAAHALIVGQSAGASLALQVAYGVGDDSVRSSCDGVVGVPVAVLAIYPAEDFKLAWEQDLKLGPVSGRDINIGYIGGSPEQFPERYRAVSAIEHVRPGLPPTMVTYGAHDHLVPISGHAELHSRLEQFSIPSVLLEIPYSDHGYDLVWGSLGAQITRHVLMNFLSAHCPSTPPHGVEAGQ